MHGADHPCPSRGRNLLPGGSRRHQGRHLMDEAEIEHAGAKNLIEQLEAMTPAHDHYDATVTVLGESIDHHVKEEEEKMFPKAKKAKVDTAALGAALTQRKHELQAERGEAEPVKARKAQSR